MNGRRHVVLARAAAPLLLLLLPAAAGMALLAAPGTAQAKVRVAVSEIRVEGDGSPALALQLQDGFMLGLMRTGADVLDPADTARRLEKNPELAACDGSTCLKSIGRLLGVKYLARVKIDVAGNSYKMVARLFSTEGSAPAALPISTKSRSCDVCTVAEARDHMLRLADALRPEIEEPAATALPGPPAAAPPASRSLVPPMLAAMAGAVAVAAGIALYLSLPDCDAGQMAGGGGDCGDHRGRSAAAGGLIGAGVVSATVGTYFTIVRLRPAAPAAPPALALALKLTF